MKLLDLYCGQGGASLGYHQAGFTVTGVDLHPQPRYPFELHTGDAIEFLKAHGHEFDAIHASPPCQAYSRATLGPRRAGQRTYPDLIAATRDALEATGRPWVIENVEGAPLVGPIRLCGSMFDLRARDTDGTWVRLQRHRLFEASFALRAPGLCAHDPSIKVAGVYGGGTDSRTSKLRGGYTPPKATREALMGITHMTLKGLSQAIPPAYTRYVGAQMIEELR